MLPWIIRAKTSQFHSSYQSSRHCISFPSFVTNAGCLQKVQCHPFQLDFRIQMDQTVWRVVHFSRNPLMMEEGVTTSLSSIVTLCTLEDFSSDVLEGCRPKSELHCLFFIFRPNLSCLIQCDDLDWL